MCGCEEKERERGPVCGSTLWLHQCNSSERANRNTQIHRRVCVRVFTIISIKSKLNCCNCLGCLVSLTGILQHASSPVVTVGSWRP